MTLVTSLQVRELLARQPAAVLLDVRLPEEFETAHVPGAGNTCVFLVSFVSDVRGRVSDPGQPVIVYGSGRQSLESTDAARRLVEAGFTAVHHFAGGLGQWRADGLPIEGKGPGAPLPVLQGAVPVDLAETRVEWTGRNLLNKHTGTLALKSGVLEFQEGWLTSGRLVLDLTTLRCTDLVDPAQNAALIAHLRSPDFLDVERHPEAELMIRQTGPVPDGRPGRPNLQLFCDFTLRGFTRPLVVLAVAGRTPEGRVAAQATLVFDRTEFGSTYGSARFFQSLGRHLVNDQVEIQVRLVA